MKRMKYFSGVAMTAALVLSLASCSSEELASGSASSSSKALSQVPLEISVDGAESRSIIEGTTLPEECSYQIYPYVRDNDSWAKLVSSTYGVKVNYVKGNSHLEETVFLPEDGTDVNVIALYGYQYGSYYDSGIYKVYLYLPDQIDVLVGHNTNVVNKNNPKAQMNFQHLMSRVTLHVTKSEDNTNSYKIPEIEVANLYNATADISPEGKVSLSWSNTTNIPVVSKDNYVLDSSKDAVDFDFLILPKKQDDIEVTLFGVGSNNLKVTLPSTNFESGKQYTFNIVIGKKDEVTTTE